MKKSIAVFICLLFVPYGQVFSQADVSNQTNYNLAISKEKFSRMIAPGATERIPFFPKEGTVSYQITWREESTSKKVNVVDVVKKGKIEITEAHLRGERFSSEPIQSSNVPSPEIISSDYKTTLAIKNTSSNIFWIREGVLSGLVLKPNQSSDMITLSLGMIEITALVDLDPLESSSGRNYMQKVVTGLIAKDQTEFLITDTHLNIPNLSGKATFVFNNKTGYDVVGVGSIATGKVIEAFRRMRQRRVKVNEGFINTAWQYLDDTGTKRQAISEFIVIEGRVMVDIKPNDLKRSFVK